MPHSHHSHSGQFCRHAKDHLEEVVLAAIRQGFQTYGLSEHAPRWRYEDLFPEEADLSPSELFIAYQSFLQEAVRLRAKYGEQISLLIGLETDYITSIDLDETAKLIAQHEEIDYIVGSVHHVHGVSIDFDRQTWLRAVRTSTKGQTGTTMILDSSGRPIPVPIDPTDLHLSSDYIPSLAELRPFFLAYFDAQYELLKFHQPEVIGHFDLCLLWIPGTNLRSEGLDEVWKRVERNVKYVVAYGGLFEANSAALRKGWETSYPSRDVFQLILSLGGRICLSDDSHGLAQVGLNYLRMRDYLSGMGVKQIWYLVLGGEARAGDERVGSRGRVVARQSEGDWRTHPFWEKITEV